MDWRTSKFRSKLRKNIFFFRRTDEQPQKKKGFGTARSTF